MVSFDLSSEQQQLKKLAHDFSRNEIRKVAANHDATGEFPLELLKKAWGIGLVNTHIDPKFGGLGLCLTDEVLLAEELGWGCTGVCTAMTANSLAQAPVIVAGSDEQKAKYLGPFAEECIMASYAVTEPGAGSDVAGLKTTADKKGDKYILNGTKMWITGAGHAKWFFVLATTDKNAGHKGMTGFVVDASLSGVIIGKKEDNMGQRCSDTRSVTFENVEVDVSCRLGEEGHGFAIAMKAFDHTRPLVAAAAVGLARAAQEHALDYSLQRKTFGKPIFAHQAISFMISDMATNVEAGRMLCLKAAAEFDAGRRNTLYAAHAKRFCADAAMKVATDAVQVYGGNGFNREYPVEKLMRDAKIFQIYEGTSQIQRLIISRELARG